MGFLTMERYVITKRFNIVYRKLFIGDFGSGITIIAGWYFS